MFLVYLMKYYNQIKLGLDQEAYEEKAKELAMKFRDKLQ